MNILSVAFKDLQILLRERGSLLQLFLLPFVFIFVFSGLGSFSESEDEAIVLPVVDLDGGEGAQQLIANINAAGGVQTTIMAEADAESQLETGELKRMLVIPEKFSTDITANRPVTLRLVNHPDTNETEKEAVRLVVDGVAQDMALQTQVLASLQHMGDMQAGLPSAQQAFTPERALAQAKGQFESASKRPLITIEQMQPGQLDELEESLPSVGTQISVPGFTVLFVFLAAGLTALSIYNEKKIGSFRRLLAAPMSKAELLLGKMLPQFLVALIQVAVIFSAGVFILPLLGLEALTLGDHPWTVLLIICVMALCATGLGVVIAAFAHTENQIGGGSSVALWVMGALGGAFFPLYLLDGFLGQIGKVVPHYWASKAFYGAMVRGQDLAGVSTEIAILLGFTLLFWLVGLWKFDFD